MTLGPDILLDPDTHDLDIVDGDLLLGADVAQAVKIRLLAVRGEWFLDRTAGIPYYEQVLVKNPNLSHVDALFRQTIVETPGINQLLSFETDFDANTRTYTVTWSADTDEGEISEVDTFTV